MRPNSKLDSEEATHCHLICCVYIKGNVKTVDTKDQSNATVYGMFVNTVDTKIKARNALNAMFVKTVDTQHLIQSTMRCENSTLLCIQWPQILYMSTLST